MIAAPQHNATRSTNDHLPGKERGFSMSTHSAHNAKECVMLPVRRPNVEYRVREHLTESEVEELLAVLRRAIAMVIGIG